MFILTYSLFAPKEILISEIFANCAEIYIEGEHSSYTCPGEGNNSGTNETTRNLSGYWKEMLNGK